MPYGIYIHVPFCIKKCNYCDFVSYPYRREQVDNYIAALNREMALVAMEIPLEARTVYIGGGTPTCLEAKQLQRLIGIINRHLNIPADIEFTMEANPGTLSAEKLSIVRAGGVNRLSIGAQSFGEEYLRRMGRMHGVDEIATAVEWARTAQFNNINLDLIFGLPGQTMAQWQDTLKRAIAFNPEHISAYGLKIEEGTPFARERDTGSLIPCDEELEADMYEELIDTLAGAGYRQYEISNFARPGFESRHNLIYWHNEEYIGFGVAAHSFIGGQRMSNYDSLSQYVVSLRTGRLPRENSEEIPLAKQAEDAVFLALRTNEGINLSLFREKYGIDLVANYADVIAKHEEKGLLAMQDGCLRLTRAGLLLANEVMVDFI